MKAVGASDLHGNDISEMIPECDILLLCGDISPNKGSHHPNEQKAWFQNKFIKHLISYKNKAKNVVFCAGNHDSFFFECHKNGKNDAEIRRILPDGVHYLCNESIVIDGIKIYGNPWCNAPQWADLGRPVWNFASHNHDFLKALYADIPNDVDIVMNHGPAYGFCDQILDESLLICAFDRYKDSLKAEHLGCHMLANRILEISDKDESKVRWIFSGHLHSASHYPQVYKNTKFIGCSILNESYKLGDYQPILIEL